MQMRQNRSTMRIDTLMKCCIKFLARNASIYENSEYLAVIPSKIKSAIIRYTIRLGPGFHSDKILTLLLHNQILHLDLSTSTVGNGTLRAISHGTPHLQELILSGGNNLFSTNGFIDVLPKFGQLEALKLSNLDQIDDTVIEHVAKYCKHLDLLDLSQCKRITDRSVDSLKILPLTRLSLSHTKITDEFLNKLPGSLLNEKLEDLNLSYCNITAIGLSNLCWDKLQYIGFEGTHIKDFEFMENSGNIKFMQWTIST